LNNRDVQLVNQHEAQAPNHAMDGSNRASATNGASHSVVPACKSASAWCTFLEAVGVYCCCLYLAAFALSLSSGSNSHQFPVLQ